MSVNSSSSVPGLIKSFASANGSVVLSQIQKVDFSLSNIKTGTLVPKVESKSLDIHGEIEATTMQNNGRQRTLGSIAGSFDGKKIVLPLSQKICPIFFRRGNPGI